MNPNYILMFVPKCPDAEWRRRHYVSEKLLGTEEGFFLLQKEANRLGRRAAEYQEWVRQVRVHEAENETCACILYGEEPADYDHLADCWTCYRLFQARAGGSFDWKLATGESVIIDSEFTWIRIQRENPGAQKQHKWW